MGCQCGTILLNRYACLFVLSGIRHCFSTLNLIAYLKEEDAAEPANGSYRSLSRKTTPDSTYGSVSSTSASGRTSPSNMSVISSTLSNFSLPFNSYSSTKSKKSSNNGSTVDETPPTIVRLNFSVEKRDQDKLFLRTNLTVIFSYFFLQDNYFRLQNQDILKDKDYKNND